MNLADYVKCLKKHAKNRKISDEEFLNAVLKPYILAGEISNKNQEDIYFDKSRTSRLINRHEDVPRALREALYLPDIHKWTENQFQNFIDDYLRKEDMNLIIREVSEMINDEENIIDKESVLNNHTNPNIFLADALIETIKLKNDGIDSEGEIIRNGAYCVKVVYGDIFKYAFKKRSKKLNIVVIPVDTEFHTHLTRKYENNPLPEVSINTLHGKWLDSWEKSGEDIEELYSRIRNSIKSISHLEISDKYPIGTIALIEGHNTIFYLLAIAEFDKENIARSSKDNIKKSIEELATYYEKWGNGYDVYIPLIGTGKSKSNLSLQESYDCIVEYYRNNKEKIQGNINIVVYKDYEKLVNIGG